MTILKYGSVSVDGSEDGEPNLLVSDFEFDGEGTIEGIGKAIEWSIAVLEKKLESLKETTVSMKAQAQVNRGVVTIR